MQQLLVARREARMRSALDAQERPADQSRRRRPPLAHASTHTFPKTAAAICDARHIAEGD